MKPMMRFPWIGVALGALMWCGIAWFVFGCAAQPPSASPPCFLFECWKTLSLSEQRDSIVAVEARKVGVPVNLAIAVSHVENWTGDSTAVSNKGAVGIMQVMPDIWQHQFEEDCGCGSVVPRKRNACLGVHVLRYYHDKHKTWERTLRAYHGSNDSPLGRDYVTSVIERLVANPDNVEPESPATLASDARVTSTHPKEGT